MSHVERTSLQPVPHLSRSAFYVGAVLSLFIFGGCKQSPEQSAVEELEQRGAVVNVNAGQYTVDLRSVPDFNDADLELLNRLPNITDLTLQNTVITDAGLSKLSTLKNLKRLILNDTSVTGEGIDHLKGSADLNVLSLRGTQVTDKSLAVVKGFPNLIRLDVAQTKVTDAGLKPVEDLVNLRVFYAMDTPITDKAVEDLKKKLPKLQVQR